MYLRYKGKKFFVDIPVSKYKETPLPISIDDLNTYVTITSWLGNRPQKCEVYDKQLREECYKAVPCLYKMPGYEADAPITWANLSLRLFKEKSIRFTAYYIPFSKDMMAHTETGFKEELVTRVLVEPQHWGKIVVTKYKIVGIEVPDQLIVNFNIELRKRF